MVGWPEIVLIAVVVLVLLGGGPKIKELMRSVGEGVREFKKALRETEEAKEELEK